MNITEFRGQCNENGSTEVFVVYNDHPTQLLINRASERSPDGFEWGYIGDGPFALAKSILYEINPKCVKMNGLIYAFMCHFIATINITINNRIISDEPDEWTLPIEKIENFIALKTANIK